VAAGTARAFLQRLLRRLWAGPRAVLMAVAAAFGPAKPPPPEPQGTEQVEEEGER
jgi:hypothetical protein